AENIYWTEFGTDASFSDGAVHMAPIAGGAPITVASGERGPYGLAVDATYVYWARHDFSSGIMKTAIAGGEVLTVKDSEARPAGILVHGADIYWTNADNPPYETNGQIMKPAI